jgi:uncharacterized protein (TIGR02996 family)
MQPVRPQLLGLLQACKEEADEDTSRLVLADWLAEQGVANLPELIRLQCRAARLSYRERQHQRVDARVRTLERGCEVEWLRPLRECRLMASFTRGLLHVEASLGIYRRRGVRQFAGTELWAWVEALCLNGERWGLPGLQGWLSSGLCRGLTSLALGGIVLGEAEAEALGGAEMPLLRALHLYPERSGAEGLKRFAKSPQASRLITLSFTESYKIRSAGAGALATGTWDRLRQLNLRGNCIGDAGAEALGSTGWVSRLEGLDLVSNGIGPTGVRALLCGRQTVSLASVRLSCNPLGDDGATVIAGTPSLARAEEIDLSGCDIGSAGASSLATSPGAAGLATLQLFNNHVGNAGAVALARSPHLSNLKGLYLSHNGISDEGGQALLGSSCLPRLTTLLLQGNAIGEPTRRALHERFGRGVVF